MIERRLTPDDPCWATSYPLIRDPRPGESLAGFMLGLDELNGFGAGQTYRTVGRHGTGPANFGPGYFITGSCFDLRQLGDLAGGLGLEPMLALTARPLAEWLFSDRRGASNTYAPAPVFRVCPECIAGGYLPLLFLFDQVTVCPTHHRELVSNCACGAPIRLFQRQDAGRCHAFPCDRRYVDIPSRILEPSREPQPFRYAAIYADLLAFAATRPAPLTTPDLLTGLRLLIARGRVHSNRLAMRMNKKKVSLRGIADVLLRFDQGAADLDAAARLVSPNPMPVLGLKDGVCPNPACALGSRVLKDGTVAGRTERQYVCKTCGTRFCRSGVLFAFDVVGSYPRWRAEKNRERLERHRQQVAVVCAQRQQPGAYLSAERVFSEAGVPSSTPYQSVYAGLLDIIAASNHAAGAETWR